MRIGFFCCFRKDPEPYVLADLCVAAIRRAMPDVPITHFTDETSPGVPTVDEVRRLPNGPMLERRIEHYSRCEGDWLFLDTDVELRGDISHVFPAAPMDVALADRHWPGIPQGDEMMHTMPFNTGVVFSRNPAFWVDVLAAWRNTPQNKIDWLTEQRCVYQVVRSGRFLVRILDGQVYNYPPRRPDDPGEGALVVHWKGKRKAWWRARAEQTARGQE